jgi:hypothetical protein
MGNIPFQSIDWNKITKQEHIGASGKSFWQTLQFEGLQVRIVSYSAGYLADHWCQKDHIVHCLEGELITELQTGEELLLLEGMSYVVSNNMSSHRSVSKNGVKLLMIDGDFLQ